MKTASKLFFIAMSAAMLFVAGCSTVVFSKANVPARAYLPSDQQAPKGFGAYGYLVFTSRPSAITQSRYEHVVEAFLRALVSAQIDSPAIPPSRQMVTFLPVNLAEADISDDPTAQFLVQYYDYNRAALITSAAGKHAAEGPILAAWRTPFEEAEGEGLVLDLSHFSEADLDRAFRIWKDRISRNPEAWTQGWNVIVFREEFRNLLQQYGTAILSVIQPGNDGV